MNASEQAIVWKTIDQNTQIIAEKDELIQPGKPFTLTPDQKQAIATLLERLRSGAKRILLKAPTGSGKTEVFLRIAIQSLMDSDGHIIILAPTRDLARQQAAYCESRLSDTPFTVSQLHGGIPPGKRKRLIHLLNQKRIHIVVGSALLLQHKKYRSLLDSSTLIVVDDVNAFDEEEDLIRLQGIKAPILFTSATPEVVGRFLRQEGAYEELFEMQDMPFRSPPTRIHEKWGQWNENIFTQIDRGMEILKQHIDQGSRIYIISRTRAKVPIIAQYIKERLKVPVSILHGEMADTAEHYQRIRQFNRGESDENRVTMMQRFRSSRPAVLVATNLVGSGLDIPMADMILITDADHFGKAELEQLLGRVGRRERYSDAVLIRGTIAGPLRKDIKVKVTTRIRKGKVITSFMAIPQGKRYYNPRRLI